MRKSNKKTDTYHYTECGLDYIHLSNGFTFHATPYGEGVSIDHVDMLHKVIAMFVVNRIPKLTGQEVRFLRTEMDLSQHKLAVLMGIDEQTIHRWEKDKTSVPQASDRLLRLLYHSFIQHKVNPIDICEALIHVPADIPHPMVFREHNNQWKEVT